MGSREAPWDRLSGTLLWFPAYVLSWFSWTEVTKCLEMLCPDLTAKIAGNTVNMAWEDYTHKSTTALDSAEVPRELVGPSEPRDFSEEAGLVPLCP